MYVSSEVAEILNQSFSLAEGAGFEYVTPELLLYVICRNKTFARAFQNCDGSVRRLDFQLKTWLEENMEQADGEPEEREAPELSQGMQFVLAFAWETALNSGKNMTELSHILHALFQLPESYAAYYMQMQGVEEAELLQEMAMACEELSHRKNAAGRKTAAPNAMSRKKTQGKDPGSGEAAETDKLSDTPSSFSDQPDDSMTLSLYEYLPDDLKNALQEGNTLADSKDFILHDSRSDSSKTPFLHDGQSDDEEIPFLYDDDSEDEYDDPDTYTCFWQQYATCLNDALEGAGPLIGRENELERTMQILCRKEKNNPLHIGEPGVGKTAITYGLARLLEENKVPAPLSGARIYALDLGSLLAGTQYRGDFEKRFKKVMDSLSQEEKPIIYIDEIHNIVGAGAVNGGSFDVSNMLKPYLAAGHIRFIGATTYEEYKKHFAKNKSLVRRFQNVEVAEPGIADTVQILEGLKETYETFHGVTYEEGVLTYAAEMSAKYINERYLPDKAIDLIDEAGAYRRMHPIGPEQQCADPHMSPAEQVPHTAAETNTCCSTPSARQAQQTVDKALIDEILSKISQIPKQMVESDETQRLATLEPRLLNRIYGQKEAISQVVNAVKFSRAGLLEEGKPLASLLFVGPTGVGKTEIARSLAEEMGIRLIRFDMSEYEEKHAVAKLIGAPAGYVGYEEGGLLTEEIRKHPHAVLLLDEIEKAHPDIYNILLQAMDYATLTDNQGRKADFRNVIIIMTSNAGASRVGRHGIGFQGQDVSADIILEEVKRTFQPEFRNRLNRIVVFNSMDDKMAEQIVEKKLGELQKMLLRKNVELNADASAKKLLKQKGISVEFGAREIERVIQSEVKPLLVDEMLFGALKDGGHCCLTAEKESFRLNLIT